jgi:hypothetical protein
MKRLIVFSALGSLLAAPLAYAGPPHWTPPGHRYPPPPAYRYYYPNYYHHHGHKNGGDSDDAAWAIGGLVLGAVIGTAAARAEQREEQATAYAPSSAPLPPPQKRKVVTCYDEVAYDGKGDPYIARQCYENWR